MFWGYPRPGCLPDEEYALIQTRKGFIRKAICHGVPVVPVYVFGNTKLFKRVELPALLESLSRLLKASLVLFWGRWGLPVPFQVPLLYAVGEAIQVGPPNPNPSTAEVDALHRRFCEALVGLFDKHKADYGWAHKTLRLV